ncbi:TetR/AcrR family transcriptional regulator [Microbulbifer thermotolerans]|uniref:Transcriptional regulator n=1 Tax=Microbulbifer thermotolerans TaxID=252514 RepID=A0A143HLE5_MICTH|nr:TetR/AcrR family transcriptional regulator [Microbulbifer thermotolerans]AMX02513.1 transcriptional regulator [Microbulbifer thermotolerans]MCX2779369.1 TetR/AcrR family transcriptional regulator [Microbulbifer thermotolerans]MCX2782427.1 TetR/AcrR family transcriptional regulator [Microbulbifer thermotolerans]MCX2795012.1 TetR/AcrR family transcriptional regulator [Microbulbifer thermotolerans]MCX2800580.1 TetR/AcrR family transcriptional regulator [Microbulbifer thermotolerans]
MSNAERKKRKSQLSPRREPVQARARARAKQILDTTGRLLEEVGLNDLTTILIAKELGVSVGSVYHYFPNKHAILYAMGEQWLASMTAVLEELAGQELEQMPLESFISELLERLLRVYQEQRGLLPLVQAMWGIPELHELDERHDELIITHLIAMYRRLGFVCPPNEMNRLARATLETCHALLLVIVNQTGLRSQRTREDLQRMLLTMLESHRGEGRPGGLDDVEAP